MRGVIAAGQSSVTHCEMVSVVWGLRVAYYPHFWQHVRRLRKRFGDARSTAGTGRALLYISKIIVARQGMLIAYFIAPFRKRKVRHELVKARSEIHGEPPLVAIKVTGGIGDLIVIARYIRDLLAASEPFRFDIYCNSVAANWVFQHVAGLRSVYSEFLFEHLKHEYPLALWMSQLCFTMARPPIGIAAGAQANSEDIAKYIQVSARN